MMKINSPLFHAFVKFDGPVKNQNLTLPDPDQHVLPVLIYYTII